MFRTLKRKLFPNPLDWMLKRAAKRNARKILLCWNRGLGDIALGLYAIVHRIKEYIPDAEITFLARENLRDGFSLLEGIQFMAAPWKRGEKTVVPTEIKEQFDLTIEAPSPTDWVSWQRGKLTPRLKWNPLHDSLFQKFALGNRKYVGVQVSAETNYGFWRNWPVEKWEELFQELEKRNVSVLLFGFGEEPKFTRSNIVDLRGKTTLFELISIIKHCCFSLVLPDSGVLSMAYYLDSSFPIRVVSLWADPNHGILKQNVASPNKALTHLPLIAKTRDLSTISATAVLGAIFPAKPMQECMHIRDVSPKPLARVGAIILAGGQGSRLGFSGPKGMFTIGGKSLFERLCEKGRGHKIAIMTSPHNHEETVTFFKKNNNFGCEVYFFQQETIPFLDDDQRELDLVGPNGNGNVFKAFVKAGLDQVFKDVDFLTVNTVDNPLTDLFDPSFISYAKEKGADAIVQCIEKVEDGRSMGVLVERKGIEITEYTELDPSQKYKYVYSGQMGFNYGFFLKMAKITMPLHWVRKKVNNRLVWKGEQFIFDVLPYAEHVCALQVPRETHYAPLKSPEDVERLKEIL